MKRSKLTAVSVFLLLISRLAFATISDPCAGPSQMFALVNRPSYGDSVCVVPNKKFMLESGYNYFNLIGGGHAHGYPQVNLRAGLPGLNEFLIILPSYIQQSVAPRTGQTQTVLSIKHEFGYTENWIFSMEGFYTPPSGGGGFGTPKSEYVLNAIAAYSFTPTISLTMMLGAGTQAVPQSAGGQSYFSWNPDVVLNWQFSRLFNFYAEVFGQTKTASNQGPGYNFDGGILYLLASNIEVDAEIGKRLKGNFGGFENYIGTGFSILMG